MNRAVFQTPITPTRLPIQLTSSHDKPIAAPSTGDPRLPSNKTLPYLSPPQPWKPKINPPLRLFRFRRRQKGGIIWPVSPHYHRREPYMLVHHNKGLYLDGSLRLSDNSRVFVSEAGIFFQLDDIDARNRRYVVIGCNQVHFNNLLKALEWKCQ